MRTALVTGAAGFVGSHLVETLLERGHRVVGLDDLSTGRLENLERARNANSFEFHRVDVRDRSAVEDALSEVDVVYHQAAVASVSQSIEEPHHTTDVNCTGTASVLAAAADTDVERVVLASSSAVYAPDASIPLSEDAQTSPQSPYGASKYYSEMLAEQYSELYDLKVIALRYFNVYGPRQDPSGTQGTVVPAFARVLIRGETPVVYGDGEQTRDFVYVDDVVAANILASRYDGDRTVFNVGRGSRTTINELLDQLQSVIGTECEPVYERERPGDLRHSEADIAAARESLDFEPTVSLREGLDRTVDHIRSTDEAS